MTSDLNNPTFSATTRISFVEIDEGDWHAGTTPTVKIIGSGRVSSSVESHLREQISSNHDRGDSDMSYGLQVANCNACDWLAVALGYQFSEYTAICPRCTDDECVRCGEPMRSSTGPQDYPGTCRPCADDISARD